MRDCSIPNRLPIIDLLQRTRLFDWLALSKINRDRAAYGIG